MRVFAIWLLKSWPFLSFIPIYLAHISILQSPCYISWLPCLNNPEINKLMGLTFQISGGLLILYSIDSNLGHFKENGLFKIINSWLKSCPIRKGEPLIIKSGGIMSSESFGTTKVRGYKVPDTLEEKIEVLQKQIDWIKEDHKKDKKEVVLKIDSLTNKIDSNHRRTENSLNTLNSKLESVTVGGLKLQVFGFNLLIYSAVLSYVA